MKGARIGPEGELAELSAVLDEISTILDNTPLIMLLVDGDRRVRRLNRAVMEFTGRTREESVGFRAGEVLRCLNSLDDPRGCGFGLNCRKCPLRLLIHETFDTGRSYSKEEAELTLVRGEKREDKVFLVSTSPVDVPDGRLILVCAEDITERKNMEKRLQTAQRMEILGQMASGIAHEVRNPLNAILAVSEALGQNFDDNHEYNEYLRQIRTQVDRLSQLMQDLLDLGNPLQPSRMDRMPLDEICKASVDLWRQSLQKYSSEVEITCPPAGSDLTITCDAARLQQVFINLLENAAQHGSEESKILIEITEPDEKSVRVRVIDRGSGISPENAERIFEPFFTTRKSGTGLGLNIIRHIVDIHGGSVTIRNNDPPPGCTVEISLPRGEES